MVENDVNWISTIDPDDPDYPNAIVSNWPADEEDLEIPERGENNLKSGLSPKANAWPDTSEDWRETSSALEKELEDKPKKPKVFSLSDLEKVLKVYKCEWRKLHFRRSFKIMGAV